MCNQLNKMLKMLACNWLNHNYKKLNFNKISQVFKLNSLIFNKNYYHKILNTMLLILMIFFGIKIKMLNLDSFNCMFINYNLMVFVLLFFLMVLCSSVPFINNLELNGWTGLLFLILSFYLMAFFKILMFKLVSSFFIKLVSLKISLSLN